MKSCELSLLGHPIDEFELLPEEASQAGLGEEKP